jgi:hypothetical protein
MFFSTLCEQDRIPQNLKKVVSADRRRRDIGETRRKLAIGSTGQWNASLDRLKEHRKNKKQSSRPKPTPSPKFVGLIPYDRIVFYKCW